MRRVQKSLECTTDPIASTQWVSRWDRRMDIPAIRWKEWSFEKAALQPRQRSVFDFPYYAGKNPGKLLIPDGARARRESNMNARSRYRTIQLERYQSRACARSRKRKRKRDLAAEAKGKEPRRFVESSINGRNNVVLAART